MGYSTRLSVTLLAACLVTGCATRSGAARPDFSGTWVLDLSRSTLEVPAPDSSIFVIDHDEPRLIGERTHALGGEADTVHAVMSTDGALRPVQVGGLEIPTRVHWDGDALVLEQEWSQGEARVTNHVRYTLSDDGETMVADEQMSVGSDSHHNVWTFRRR